MKVFRLILKTLSITLASLVGVVLIVAGVLVYIVFTPERLTPIVRNVAENYITCEHEIGTVDLTLISSFPEASLRVHGLCIVNPMEGTASDTVVVADNVVARLDIKKLLQGTLDVHEIALQGVSVCGYVNESGQANYDVIALEADTTEEDTLSDPFLKQIEFTNLRIVFESTRASYTSVPDSLTASLTGSEITLQVDDHGGDKLVNVVKANIHHMDAQYKGTEYVQDMEVRLSLPHAFTLTDNRMVLDKGAMIGLNQFELSLEGSISLPQLSMDTIEMDLLATTNTWRIQELLPLIPKDMLPEILDSIVPLDGNLNGQFHITGMYTDSLMPLVEAAISLSEGDVQYLPLPFRITPLSATIHTSVDLNDIDHTDITIDTLCAQAIYTDSHAETEPIRLIAYGQVQDVLDKIYLDLKMDLNCPQIDDLEYFLPEGIIVDGYIRGHADIRMNLDDLLDMQLQRGRLHGDFDLGDLRVGMDSLDVNAQATHLVFNIPNNRINDEDSRVRKSDLSWLGGCMQIERLEVQQGDDMQVSMNNTDIDLSINDILHKDVWNIDIDIETHSLTATMDTSLKATIPNHAVVCAYVEYDTQDTTHIPTLSCTFDMDRLLAQMDTISADIHAPKGNATIKGGRRDKTQPRLHIDLQTPELACAYGNEMKVHTQALNLQADARHKELNEKDTLGTDNEVGRLLLEWNPRLKISLNDGRAELAAIADPIRIPRMAMQYSNRDFAIDSSAIELGHSRFELIGQAKNIGKWLRDEDMLTGDFTFRAPHADINELLDYTNGLGGDETENEGEAPTAIAEDEPNPYMVPRNCNVTLNTEIVEAMFGEQRLRNMGGRVYIKDGTLIIEEMGFICEAAKMSLTALYRTPRKNHLYVGLDYHMTDIRIDELIDMIPQVDTLLPMLASFKGDANFHLAAETYLNANYDLKTSTLRGACSIDGKDLVLLDNETFGTIAKLLLFKKSTENKIDSVSAEIGLFRNQIDIYPFLISMDRYKAAVGGEHTLEGNYDYHVSLLSPFHLGVNAKTEPDKKHPGETKLKIGLGKCKYAKDFEPVRTEKVETESLRMREIIRKALTE